MGLTCRVIVALGASAFFASATAVENAAPSGPLAEKIAACDKLANPAPNDNSATGRALAVIHGQGLRTECKKRAEAEAAPKPPKAPARSDAKPAETEEEWRANIKKGGSKPLKEYKY